VLVPLPVPVQSLMPPEVEVVIVLFLPPLRQNLFLSVCSRHPLMLQWEWGRPLQEQGLTLVRLHFVVAAAVALPDEQREVAQLISLLSPLLAQQPFAAVVAVAAAAARHLAVRLGTEKELVQQHLLVFPKDVAA